MIFSHIILKIFRNLYTILKKCDIIIVCCEISGREGRSINGIFDKISEVLGKDRFEAEFKNALKRCGFTVVSQEGNVYELTNGTVSFDLDTGKMRDTYKNDPSQEKLFEIINEIETKCNTESRMVSFTNGQAFLRFVIMQEKNIREDMLYSDFIPGLKKVVVYTPDDRMINYLTDSIFKRWGVPREVIFSVSDRNMCRLLDKAEIKESNICEGVKALEFELPSKRLASAMIMCNDFRRAVYKYMGAKFLVVIPSDENMLILENITNNILESLGSVIVNEYKKAQRPLTTDVMLFTPNGIQIAGHFSLQNGAPAASGQH